MRRKSNKPVTVLEKASDIAQKAADKAQDKVVRETGDFGRAVVEWFNVFQDTFNETVKELNSVP